MVVCHRKLCLQILVIHFSLILASLATLSWLMLHGVNMEGAVLSAMLVSPRRYSELARWTSICINRDLNSRPLDYEVGALSHELPRRGLLIREYKREISLLCSIFSELMCLFVFWSDSLQWTRASSFTRFLDYTQRRTTVGRTPLDEWSACRGELYLTKYSTHNRQTSIPPVGFEPTISAGKRPQTHALDSAATGTGVR